MDAIVIGSGGFGRHYARLLSEMDRIDRLVITRTDLAQARKQASELQNGVAEITGKQVTSGFDLENILTDFKPDFAAVVAKDKIMGDDIHGMYVDKLLDKSKARILVEKPYSEARGNGMSVLNLPKGRVDVNRVSINLPLLVVQNLALRKVESYCADYTYCRDMEILWESDGNRDVRNDLGPHAFSLLPYGHYTLSMDCHRSNNDEHAVFMLQIANGFRKDVTISLKRGNKRRLRLNENIYEFRSEIRRNEPITVLYMIRNDGYIDGDKVLDDEIIAVRNPLLHNIKSVMMGKPIVSFADAYQCQIFLEHLHRMPLGMSKYFPKEQKFEYDSAH